MAELRANSTKSRVLALLKRSGGSTVDDLTRLLGLAPMTIRQHLTALQRDGLISAREVRRPTGRPHFVFTLTADGEETFPRRYDVLAEMILDEIAFLRPRDLENVDAAGRRRIVLERVAERTAAGYRDRFDGKALSERVRLLAELLQEESGFAEYESTEKGYEVRDYNCVFHKLARSDSEVCHWHLTLMRTLIGADVLHDRSIWAGAECCRFLIAADQRTGKEPGRSNDALAVSGKASPRQVN